MSKFEFAFQKYARKILTLPDFEMVGWFVHPIRWESRIGTNLAKFEPSKVDGDVQIKSAGKCLGIFRKIFLERYFQKDICRKKRQWRRLLLSVVYTTLRLKKWKALFLSLELGSSVKLMNYPGIMSTDSRMGGDTSSDNSYFSTFNGPIL